MYRGTYSLSIIQGSGRGAGRTDDEQRSGGRRRLRRPRGVQVDHREKGTRSCLGAGGGAAEMLWRSAIHIVAAPPHIISIVVADAAVARQVDARVHMKSLI